MPISTRDLSSMPEIEALRRYLQSAAMLEAILVSGSGFDMLPDHRFDSRWVKGEQLAMWDNGQGDNFFCVFTEDGCWIKGFDHEAMMTPYRVRPPSIWKDMFKGMPTCFKKLVNEPAFECDHTTTFCIWRRAGAKAWSRGDFELPKHRDPDGSAWILELLDRTPDDWTEFENDNFELGVSINGGTVTAIFEHQPLTLHAIRQIDIRANIEACQAAAGKIGYPTKINS
ncbi:MAG TPA: hypothetical protein VHM90_14245 [Phycisphaerae bacterium]|nr:hypothetical protein [Phycisphaerae bacterium]